ncbi:hypothetical protein JL49_19595 [Pseudoalteromonas luteoviolacea]|nr:hypothetical protein JL49_19595 [Pseudoalteromonas luteoviolacea]
MKIKNVIFGAIAASASINVSSQTLTYLEKDTETRALSATAESSSGDAYDPISGSLSFAVTDVSLPGNFELPVEFRRTFSPFSFQSALGDLSSTGMGQWLIDVPYIRAHYVDTSENIYNYNLYKSGKGWGNGYECTHTSEEYTYSVRSGSQKQIYPHTFWQGKLLHIPNQISEPLVKGKGEFEGKQITKSQYLVSSCFTRTDGGGQGFIVTLPDGVKYTFDHEITRPHGLSPPIGNAGRRGMMMATKIEDKFGNTVHYHYSGNKLNKISASDGRVITIHYSGDMISRVSANGRSWYYGYINNKLRTVTLPNNTSWTYPSAFYEQQYRAMAKTKSASYDNPGVCDISDTQDTSVKSFTVTTPTGLNIKYGLQNIFHGRHDVFAHVNNPNHLDSIPAYYFTNLNCSVRRNLVFKSISGNIDKDIKWQYSYSQNAGLYQSNGNDIPNKVNSAITRRIDAPMPYGKPDSISSANDVKTVTITGEGKKTVFYINRHTNRSVENRIVAEDHVELESNKLLKRVEYNFKMGDNFWDTCGKLNALNSSLPFCDMVTNEAALDNRINLYQRTEKIYDDSASSSTVYKTTYKSYDKYGYPLTIISGNNKPALSSRPNRYDTYTYQHNTDIWELGNIKYHRVQNYETLGTAVSYTDYYSFAPYNAKYISKYGKVQKRFVAYHTDGNIKRIELPNKLSSGSGNQYVEYQLYKRGIPRKIVVPEPKSSTRMARFTEVDDNGWVTSETNFNGVKTSFGYDSIGRLTAIDFQNDDKNTWLDYKITWSGNTQQTIERCALNSYKTACSTGAKFRTINQFDGLGRLTKVTDSDLSDHRAPLYRTRYKRFKYNHLNQNTFTSYVSSSAVESKGITTTFDALGRIKTSSKAGMGTVNYEYISGHEVKVIDAKGNETKNTYHAYGSPDFNKLRLVESPENVTTEVQYDVFGKVERVTQSGNGISFKETRYYNPAHQLCSIVRSDTGSTTYFKYTDDGRLKWKQVGDRLGCNRKSSAAITYTYNNLSKIDSISYPKLPDTKFHYDKQGNLISIVAGGIKQTYSYNGLNLVESEQLTIDSKPTLNIDYGYDGFANRSFIKYPNGTHLSYKMNGFGEPTQVASLNSAGSTKQFYAAQVQYYPHGLLKGFTYGNGVKHSSNINPYTWLPETVEDSRGSTAIVDLHYSYDSNSNVTSLINSVDQSLSLTHLSYDGLDRLISTTGGSKIGSSTIRYDALGNITYYKTKRSTLTYNYNYTNNRLESVSNGSKNVRTFSYDHTGNVTNNGQYSLSYAANNQMLEANGNSYRYDGFNRRVERNEKGSLHYSFYGNNGELFYTEKGNVSGEGVNYIYLGKKLIAKTGNVVPKQNTDQQGYLPYGDSVSLNQDDIGYTGHKFDTDLGLVYMQARYYDPVIGRFYSNDPIGFRDIHSFNRYAYANNNPYRYTDPDGKSSRPTLLRRPSKVARENNIVAEAITGVLAENLPDGAAKNFFKDTNSALKTLNKVGRSGAMTQAKKDAKVPRSQKPLSVDKVKMTDGNGQTMKDSQGNVVYTREYTHQTTNGKTVVIQDHSAGHEKGGQGPHLNVRPIENTRTGKVEGTKAHYEFDK